MPEPQAPPTADEPRENTRAPATAFLIGVVAGVLSGLLGIGGGLLMVPALTHLLNIRPHRAVGTSLAVIIPTALAGAFRYHVEGQQQAGMGLDGWVVLWLAVGGVLGGVVGAVIANALNARQLKRVFGTFVIATGVYMIARLKHDPGSAAGTMNALLALQMVGVGVLVGVVSGLLGVGGGLVMVPALALLLNYNQHLAQGTSLAVIIPVSISGTLVHMSKGNVVRGLAIPLALGGVIGAWMMGWLVFGIPRDLLRALFGLFLLIMGASMLASRRPPAPLPGKGTA